MLRSILLLAALGTLVPILGCSKGTGQSNADLQEEKLRLEVMRAERQELDSLLAAQKQMRSENQDAFQQLDRRRTELQTMKQTVEKERQRLDADLAQANAKLAAAEGHLNAKVRELKTMQAKNQKQLDEIAAGKKEVAAALASMQSGRASAAPSVAAEKQATEKSVAEQERARRKYLESLADATVGIMKSNPMSPAYGNPRLVRQQLLERLQAEKPGVSQRQFQENANRTAEEFAMKSTTGTLTEAEVAAIRDFRPPQTTRQASSTR